MTDIEKLQHRLGIDGLVKTWYTSRPWRKYLNLVVVLLLAALGYLVGPKDLLPGDYSVEVNVFLGDDVLMVTYPFTLGSEVGQSVTETQTDGTYQLIVEASNAYWYGLGQSINYRLQVLDAAGQPVRLALDDVTSMITGENVHQVLPPTSRTGEWLEFTMRVPYKARIALGLLLAVAALWLTELVPLAAASLLIPVVMVVTAVTDPETVLQPFFHPIIVLFFAGFLLAEGMHRTGVDRIIALNILKRASLKPAYLMLTMMGLAAFLSMWMSNTASVAIIIPIALAVLEKIPGDLNRTGFRRALILGIAYAATVGGIGSAIGTPANILAMTFLSDFAGADLTFADWFYYGLPVVILMVPIIWLYLILVARVQLRHVSPHLSHNVYNRELAEMGGLNKDQRLLLLVFVAVVGLWLTDYWHHIHAAIIALGGVLILFFTETIKKDDLKRINWDALLTFGGGLALGNMLVLTGVSDWIALHLTGLVNLPPLLVVFFVAGLTLLIGAVISNTACAAMLIPLAIPLAQILHLDPRLLVAVVAIASSIDFALVVGTPPTMMAYSTGLFEAKEIFKRGIVLDIIGILVLSFGVIWIWRWLGVISF
jgi:sodium-dependent dicarboxylate transporter 2/3/5